MSKFTEKLRGRFLVIDGPDGAGKSTQLKLLAEYLRGKGLDVLTTRDPGGTPIGEEIRRILLDNSHAEMTVGSEILLYMASRTQLMGQVIAPALQTGTCVLCDRWVSATVAYQVAEGKATAEEILSLYDLALKGIRPDLTLLLDVPAEMGLSRVSEEPDRIEAKGLDYHKKVRQLFLKQAELQHPDLPKVAAIIDAVGNIDDVQTRLRHVLENWSFTS